MENDRLLSVAAIEVSQERILANRSYVAVVRQQEPSTAENILVHGIGAEAQLAGRPAAEALHELNAFMDGAIPAAFHALFDKAILERAFAQAGMKAPRKRWLDLATLAPVLFPDRDANHLDAWLAAFGIDCDARHDALNDAYSTAQLLLVLLQKARREGVASAEAFLRLASSGAWVPRRR